MKNLATTVVVSLGNVIAGFVLIIVLIVFLFVAVFIVPGYSSAAIHAGKRACFNDIIVVSAAIDIATMDGKAISDVTTAEGHIDFSALSLRGKEPECPFQGTLRLVHAGPETYVCCTFHGDPEDRMPGNSDPGYSGWHWFMLWLRGIR